MIVSERIMTVFLFEETVKNVYAMKRIVENVQYSKTKEQLQVFINFYILDKEGSANLSEFFSAPHRTVPYRIVPYRIRPSIVLKNGAPYKRI
jgi:hypothetical protein